MNTVYEQIKIIANNSGLTIKNVADTIGMTENGVYAAFRNNSMKLDTLQKIADTLNVKITTFFDSNEIITTKNNSNDTKKINSTEISLLQNKEKDENLYERLMEEKDKRIQERDKIIEEKDKQIQEVKKENEELKKLAFDKLNRSKQGTNNYRGFVPQQAAGGLVYENGIATEIIESPSAASFE